MKIKNKKLYFLTAVFVLPMMISGLLYHYHTHFNLHTVNYGVLLNPPIHADALYLTEDVNQDPKNKAKKIWRIVYIESEKCGANCLGMEKQLQQVRKALGKDQDRVAVLDVRKNLQNRSNKIYLVDPLDNVFMYYPDSTDPMNILKDLKRVLEVSQIG